MIAVIGAAKVIVKIQMTSDFAPEQMAGHGNVAGFTGMETAGSSAIGTPVSVAGASAAGASGMQESKMQDDIEIKYVGCGFNIAEHLAAMGHETAFISALGSDPLGLAAAAHLKSAGIDTDGVKILPGTTPVCVEMCNILGDVEMMRVNDSLLQSITPELIEESGELLQRAQAIVLDGTLPSETLKHIAKGYGGKEDIRLYFDPGSKAGGGKVKDVTDMFYSIMPGRMEAEAMTGKTILSEDQLMEAGAEFCEKGVSRIIITMKGGGLYYKEGMAEGILRPERVLSFAEVSGAGDVVSAAVVAETESGKPIEETAKFAMAKAADFLKEVEDKWSI